MKKLLLIFLLIFCVNLFSQTEIKRKQDTVLVYYNSNKKGKEYLKDLLLATELANETQIDSLIMQTNVKYGLQSYFKRDTKGLDIAQENLNRLYLKSKDSFALAKVYHYKALIHLVNVKLDSSIYYYHQSKNISILIKDSLEVGRRLLSMANTLKGRRDYLGSEIAAIEGIKYLEPIKDTRYLESLYIAVGISLNGTGKFEEARQYFTKALEVNKKNPSKSRRESSELNILNNIGMSYNLGNRFKEAVPYFIKGLSFKNIKKEYSYQYQILLGNLSYSYLNLGEKEKSLKGYYEVLKFREAKNDIYRMAISHDAISHYFIVEKETSKALYHARKSLEYADKSGNTIRKLNALSKLSRLEKPSRAKVYYEMHIKLNDSLIADERQLRNQFARVRYETDKKEKENTILKIENDNKQLELEQEKQQKTISFLLAIGSLLILGISVLVFKNRRKKLAFEAQLEKVEAREEERKQIAKSLHDEVAGDLRVLYQKLDKNKQIEIAEGLNKVKDNVRDLSHQLSSVRFEEVSFKYQVINLISDYFTAECKIFVSGLKENEWVHIKNPMKRTLYLCIRESLQNAKKYANATQINIELKQEKNKVCLQVKDNGVGFDSTRTVKGIGLKNQVERVEELNGKLEVMSNNKGTSILIEIPLYA